MERITSFRDRLLGNGARQEKAQETPAAAALAREKSKEDSYQELKTRIHRRLIERLDLSNADTIGKGQLRNEIGMILADIINKENVPLSQPERERLIQDVQHETFGLGPLEPLLADQDIADILVNGSQNVYVENGRVTQIEGDPDSPISRGRMCPKGSASLQLTTGPGRHHKVKYRRPHGTEWEELSLDTAMDMIADRVIATRKQFWEWEDDQGRRTRRTLGIASLGGATLDNEENYLMKKLYTALGAVQVENQARI